MVDGFDFVIVGGGTAGTVLARRLSERSSVRVLLLEAGRSDATPLTRVPAGYAFTVQSPAFSWGYQTEPVPGLGGRRLPCPRGKVLGGSSSINGMIYVRGQREDFDGWRDLGNQGWGYSDLLPYFRRAFHQTRGEDTFHGQGGPMPVADGAAEDSLSQAFLEGLLQSGLLPNPDFNGAQQEGAGYYQFNIEAGVRQSASRAYLDPARARANLRVETDATVRRVVFEGRRAVGVELERDGRLRFVRIAREVILCAGAIGSPQLLQLSGIGRGEELARLGIQVVSDVPGVGENLQDHLLVRGAFAATLPSMNRLRSPLTQVRVLGRYALTRNGPLAHGPCTVGAFFRTRAELSRPDAQLHFIPCSFDVKNGKEQLHAFDGMTSCVYQLRPSSRGRVVLRSRDPHARPRIEAAHLETELDRTTLVAALKRQRAFFLSPRLSAVRGRELYPGDHVQSDSEWLDFARETGESAHHPVGTCRMGVGADAVVDRKLAVHGVEGLRVVDASIMPTLVSGNTHAATIAVAERAADLLIEGEPPCVSEVLTAGAGP